MKLLVGLGNPGERYKNNRHNVGFMVVDTIVTRRRARETRSPDSKLATCYLLPVTKAILAKSQTFMNASGNAVKKLVAWFKIKPEDIYIIHDDLDVPLGQYKIQKGKGPKVHYGVQSIDKALGTRDYWRVRVGVENREVPSLGFARDKRVPRGEPARNTSQRVAGGEYVLQDFTPEEKPIIADVIRRIITDLNGRL